MTYKSLVRTDFIVDLIHSDFDFLGFFYHVDINDIHPGNINVMVISYPFDHPNIRICTITSTVSLKVGTILLK